MTEYDRQLIKLARLLTSIDWGLAFSYAEKAETIEAKHILEDIGKSLYHKEEYLADNL
jgi:hypothetical protein